MSDLSDARDALDQLDERMRLASAERVSGAAADTHALAARLAELSEHPDLGVGEARAALAEAAFVLGQHQPI